MRVLVIVMLLLPTLAFGGENCASMGGVCRDRCGENETAMEGAFVDCDDKQDCCAAKAGGSTTDRQAVKEAAPSPEKDRDKDAR